MNLNAGSRLERFFILERGLANNPERALNQWAGAFVVLVMIIQILGLMGGSTVAAREHRNEGLTALPTAEQSRLKAHKREALLFVFSSRFQALTTSAIHDER